MGFLSPKSDIRKKELKELISLSRTFVILDTPYRLKTVLSDIEAILPERDIFIGFNLTMEDEIQFRGTAKIILEKIRDISGDENFKGEYVIVVSKEIIRHNEN